MSLRDALEAVTDPELYVSPAPATGTAASPVFDLDFGNPLVKVDLPKLLGLYAAMVWELSFGLTPGGMPDRSLGDTSDVLRRTPGFAVLELA